jgi:hypothetical protein
MGMPAMFWGEAVRTAVYILNRAPTRSVDGKTPYEAWHDKKPHVQHFRTFGCTTHVKNIGPGLNKLSDRSTPMVMIGYEEGTYCYRLYDPTTKKLHISRDVVFEERRSWEWNSGDTTTVRTSALAVPSTFTVAYEDSEAVTTGGAGGNPGTPQSAATPVASPEPRTPAAVTPAHDGWATPLEHDANLDSDSVPRHYRRLDDLYNDTTQVEAEYNGLCLLAADEPASVQEALGEACWKQAMDTEMAAILENKTWELTTLPAGQRAIGLKWVLKVKRDPTGNIVKHKARLVAKGYAQRHGVDFDEVFAPVARMEMVRLLLALAAADMSVLSLTPAMFLFPERTM